MMPKILYYFGYVLAVLGVFLIGFGLITTWYYQGFAKVQEILNPFNIVSYVSIVLTLAPGIFFMWLGNKMGFGKS